jgi:hypothetical protein
MSGNPIDFSLDEQIYILNHIGPGPSHQSWGDIARNLNRIYPEYNKGKRSRIGIWRWTKEYTSNYQKKINKPVLSSAGCSAGH